MEHDGRPQQRSAEVIDRSDVDEVQSDRRVVEQHSPGGRRDIVRGLSARPASHSQGDERHAETACRHCARAGQIPAYQERDHERRIDQQEEARADLNDHRKCEDLSHVAEPLHSLAPSGAPLA